MELDQGCFFWATDRARSATFIEPEQGIEGIQGRNMNPEGV
jgi:hypothetical protein